MKELANMEHARGRPQDVLGVSLEASELEIRNAFLQFVKKLHPDQFQDSTQKLCHEALLLEIQDAYESLMKGRRCAIDDGDTIEENKRQWARMRMIKESGRIEPLNTLLPRLEREICYLESCELIISGRCEEAIQRVKKLIRDRRTNWMLHLKLAEACLGTGTFILARQAAEQAIKLGGDAALCHLTLGRIEERQGKHLGARQHYTLAYKHDRNDPRVQAAYWRGSLVAEAFDRRFRAFLRLFRWTPGARSFSYCPGLLTIEHVARFAAKFVPLPNTHSFRYCGIC